MQVIQEDESFGTAVNVYKDKLIYKAIAGALGLVYMPLELWRSRLFLLRILQSATLSFIKQCAGVLLSACVQNIIWTKLYAKGLRQCPWP